MLNSYFTEFSEVLKDGTVVRYSYTFKDKDMRHAKLHVVDVCRQMDIFPLFKVWRISHEAHVGYLRYCALPKPYIVSEAEYEAA